MALRGTAYFSEIEADDSLFKIPLRNCHKEIVAYSLVDEHNYEKVKAYSWYIKNGYAITTKKRVHILLHHLVKGKPINNLVVDHHNGNRLDNREINLEFVSHSANSQNRAKSSKQCSSSYIGVSAYGKKWHAQCCCDCKTANLGYFEDEVRAAKTYDIYVLLKYGPRAQTNGLVTFEEVVAMKLDPDDLVQKKPERELPKGISKCKNSYYVKIKYNGTIFDKTVRTLELAIEQLQKLSDEIEEIKRKEKEEHYTKEIIRDVLNNAVIPIKDEDGVVIDYVIVDDKNWHDLMLYSWCRTRKHFLSNMKGKICRMHRYILLGDDAFTNKNNVHHIDGNPKNNKISNLYEVRPGINVLNVSKCKTRATSSKYVGVSYDKTKKKFKAEIRCNHQYYFCGYHNTEKDAARARNAKALELFEEHANLHDISDEEIC